MIRVTLFRAAFEGGATNPYTYVPPPKKPKSTSNSNTSKRAMVCKGMKKAFKTLGRVMTFPPPQIKKPKIEVLEREELASLETYDSQSETLYKIEEGEEEWWEETKCWEPLGWELNAQFSRRHTPILVSKKDFTC